MKRKNTKRKNNKNQKEKFDFYLIDNWNEYAEEEAEDIEDLMEEFHIPTIECIEPVDDPGKIVL
jgi:sortase (surface protein transpeptidase)